MLKRQNPVGVDFYFSLITRDMRLALRLLEQIAAHHPQSNIVAIADGPIPAPLPGQPGLTFIEGERLKKTGSIGAFTTRSLALALAFTTTPWLIKLDPDSFLHKPITGLTDAHWQGLTRQVRTPWGLSKWANGGGYAISREAMTRILDSGELLHPRYQEPLPLERENGRCYEDCRLGHVANNLGIYPVDCPALISPPTWRKTKSAISHPVA